MTKSFSIEIPGNIGKLPVTDSENVQMTLKGLLDIVLRRFWLIAVGFTATFLAVAAFTFTQTPLYKSTTQIIVDTNEKNVINIAGVMGGLGADTAVIDTEVKVIGSSSLLKKVAVNFNLIDDAEFNPYLVEPKPGILDNIRSLFGFEKEISDPFEGLSESEIKAEHLREAVTNLARKVNVARVGTTFILTVEVTSKNPETAAKLANGIAEQYQTNQLDEKLEATKVATAWLSTNVEELENEVLEKQRRVEQYRASSGLLEASGTRLTEQNLTFLEGDRARIKSELDEARSRLDNVQNTQSSGGDVTSLAEVLDSAVVTDLKSQRAAILRRQADLRTELGPQHPDMIRIRSEVADIDRQIATETGRIIDRLRRAVLIAERQLAEKNRQIAIERNELARNNANTVELKALERDARTSEELYEEFLSRFKETRPQNEIAEADARILSAAAVPTSPSSPNKILNLLLGIILGGLVGGGLAILTELFDNKISSGAEVGRKLGTSLIGSVPQITNNGLLGLFTKNPADYLVENPFTAYAESIRYLRTAIAFSDPDSNTKTVAVTSSLPDEGKTSTTLALGRMSAMSGSRTLVIDGDFRRRQLSVAAGFEADVGLVEYLSGTGTLKEVIFRDPKTALDIFPLSLHGQTPHDVFGTRAYDELINLLKEQYDLILIDTGPLLLMAEARVVAGKCDKTILVVRWRATTVSAAKQSLDLLRKFRANLLGITLSRVDLSRRRYHKDPSATNKAYKKYYLQNPKRFSLGRILRRLRRPGPENSAPSGFSHTAPSQNLTTFESLTGANDVESPSGQDAELKVPNEAEVL